MAEPEQRRPQGVARIFFQEILEGDRLKLEAQSNVSQTGGGARDLRVPHDPFGRILRRMFPEDRSEVRRRGGSRREVVVYGGSIYWLDEEGNERHAELTYEPPTDARPSEGRLARIHQSPPLTGRIPDADEGRVFLLLVQEDSGKVFPHYVTSSMLQDPGFNQDIAAVIRRCVLQTPDHRSVRGFVDYVTQENYCHG